MAGGGVRVIAGEWRGRRLAVPDSARPTTDRVREAVFSAVTSAIPGAHVLDLYAGSGAFGIESLSRGAARAVFVDSDRGATSVIRANLATFDAARDADVFTVPVERFLQRPPPGPPFDLVFADAPYADDSSAIDGVLAALAAPGWLGPLATIVVERSAKGIAPTVPDSWVVRWSRTYGDTLVTLASSSDV